MLQRGLHLVCGSVVVVVVRVCMCAWVWEWRPPPRPLHTLRVGAWRTQSSLASYQAGARPHARWLRGNDKIKGMQPHQRCQALPTSLPHARGNCEGTLRKETHARMPRPSVLSGAWAARSPPLVGGGVAPFRALRA